MFIVRTTSSKVGRPLGGGRVVVAKSRRNTTPTNHEISTGAANETVSSPAEMRATSVLLLINQTPNKTNATVREMATAIKPKVKPISGSSPYIDMSAGTESSQGTGRFARAKPGVKNVTSATNLGHRRIIQVRMEIPRFKNCVYSQMSQFDCACNYSP